MNLSLIKTESQEQVITYNFDHGNGLYDIHLLCVLIDNK